MAFDDPPNSASLICKHVLNGELPILFVSHDEDDGGWQFLCNVNEHEVNDIAIVALHRATDLDPTVSEVSDLPLGFIATRAGRDQSWYVQLNPDSVKSN